MQDLAEVDPNFTRIDDFADDFFTSNNINNNPDNSLNKFDPNQINFNFLNDNIRNISNVNSGFSQYSDQIFEGRDYTILENARKLMKVNTQLIDSLGLFHSTNL